MFENKFNMIEGSYMNVEELGHELESITGKRLIAHLGNSERYVTQKPNINSDNDTFNLTFNVQESQDIIDVVATTNKKERTSNHDFNEEKLRIDLISYIRRDVPENNKYEEIE